jgi:hypothetical protein
MLSSRERGTREEAVNKGGSGESLRKRIHPMSVRSLFPRAMPPPSRLAGSARSAVGEEMWRCAPTWKLAGHLDLTSASARADDRGTRILWHHFSINEDGGGRVRDLSYVCFPSSACSASYEAVPVGRLMKACARIANTRDLGQCSLTVLKLGLQQFPTQALRAMAGRTAEHILQTKTGHCERRKAHAYASVAPDPQ